MIVLRWGPLDGADRITPPSTRSTPRTCTERSRRIDLLSVARSHSDSSVHVSRAIRLARNHIPEL
jgi:hypothetical protein